MCARACASECASPQKAQFLEYAIYELAWCTQNNFISVFVLVEQLVALFFATAKRYFLAFGSEAYHTLRKTSLSLSRDLLCCSNAEEIKQFSQRLSIALQRDWGILVTPHSAPQTPNTPKTPGRFTIKKVILCPSWPKKITGYQQRDQPTDKRSYREHNRYKIKIWNNGKQGFPQLL